MADNLDVICHFSVILKYDRINPDAYEHFYIVHQIVLS
jgi:hypothetical protein